MERAAARVKPMRGGLGSGLRLVQTWRMEPIRFGTDGWRAVIAEDFTFANVARAAQATADFWKSEVARQNLIDRRPNCRHK
jgi:hypothetical protein